MYLFPTKGLQELVEQQNQYLGGALLTIAQRALEVFLVTVLPFVTYVVSNFSCCVDAMSLKKKITQCPIKSVNKCLISYAQIFDLMDAKARADCIKEIDLLKVKDLLCFF